MILKASLLMVNPDGWVEGLGWRWWVRTRIIAMMAISVLPAPVGAVLVSLIEFRGRTADKQVFIRVHRGGLDDALHSVQGDVVLLSAGSMGVAYREATSS